MAISVKSVLGTSLLAYETPPTTDVGDIYVVGVGNMKWDGAAYASVLGTAASKDITTSPTDTTSGHLLKVGDWGIGAPRTIVSNNDLLADDNFTDFYGVTLVNCPPGITSGWVQKFSRSGGYRRVVFRGWTSSGVRTFENVYNPSTSTWTGWVELYHSGNTGTAALANITTSSTDTTPGRVLKVGDWGIGGGYVARAELTKRAFVKTSPRAVAFTRTGFATVSTGQQLYIDVADLVIAFASGTAVTMPALTVGTDYAIYACADDSLRADASFSAPAGYTTANSRQIGGFHYGPGAAATGRNTGGDTSPQINPFSLWDLKFRPVAADPRGMALIAGAFWADIYMLGVDHITNGTSKYNVAMATGTAPPKIPTMFGGSGSSAYPDGNWFSFREVLMSYGKRFPRYAEFQALAYGVMEKISCGPATGGNAPLTGQNNAGHTSTWEKFTSIFGVVQATGNLWSWGEEFGGPYGAASYVDTPDARGQYYNAPNAALFGGTWTSAVSSGSRASAWSSTPSYSNVGIGARGVCDHLILE